MAHSLRRPLSSLVGLSPSIQRRSFSQLPALRGQDRSQQAMAQARPAQQKERSLKVMSKNVGKLPSDMGILDSTFVTPTGPNIPSLFASPRDLLKLQWNRIKYRFRDLLSLQVLKFSSPKDKGLFNRRVKLERSTIAPTAVALHTQMYSAFAEGDSTTLRKICTDGVYDSMRARISARAKGEKVQWELVQYNKRAKVVSNRAARLPMEGAAVRQAVVRICSRQKLTRWRRVRGENELEMVPGSGKEKDVVEYVVVQRRCGNWKEEDWQVWGTTGETTLKDVEEWQRRELEA